MTTELTPDGLREAVRAKYAERAHLAGGNDSCCGGSTNCSPITSNLYAVDEVTLIPEDALKASLGCGNPTALGSLKPRGGGARPGERGGIEVLLSARRVGPTGFAYGLDMTDEMLGLAEKNVAEQGAKDVRFLKGHIEDIPLPDSAVDPPLRRLGRSPGERLRARPQTRRPKSV